MMTFWKRECRSYLHSPVGYVLMAGMLCVIGVNTFMICIQGRQPAFERVLSTSALLFLLMVPILTMRAFSEDRKDGVLLFYYSMPIGMGGLVLGKYLALLTMTAVPLAVSALYPLILSRFGRLDGGVIACTYLGLFFMAAALLAVGLFFSALLENQVAASAVTFVALLAGYLMPALAAGIPGDARTALIGLEGLVLVLALIWFLMTRSSIQALAGALAGTVPLCLLYRFTPRLLEGKLSALLNSLSVYARFYTFEQGILDLTGLVYYGALAAVMLFLSVQVLEYRRYR